MKFRPLGILIVLVLALAAGCRKEEPEPEKKAPGKQETTQKSQVPEGFARIEEEVFVTEDPIRVEQYVNYLNSTGQEVPQWIQSPMIDYQDPVTGLNREEASELARFLKLRLPTPEEWEKAAEIVGDRPYPWAEEASEDAVLYFVRDWKEGESGEKQAIKARQNLFDQINQLHREKIKEKAKKLKQLEKTVGKKVSEQWQSFKKQLTGVIEEQKNQARKAAQTEGRETVLKILRRVGEEKKKIIHALFKEDASKEDVKKAKQDYSTFLKNQRDNLQKLSDKVVKSNQTLSKQARELMKKLEGKAQNLIHNINNTTDGFVVRSEQVTDPQAVGALRRRLRRELDSLEEATARMQKQLKQTQKDLAQKAKKLEAEIARAKENNVAQEITTVKEKIKSLNENVDAQFEQEPHLFKELEDYTELAATKKALEQEIAVLKEALEIFTIPEETTSGEEAESPDTTEGTTGQPTEEAAGGTSDATPEESAE